MKNAIIIMLPSNSQIYSETVEVVTNKIVKYFGTKYAKSHEEYPIVNVDCDITEEDMDNLQDGLHPSVQLTAIIGPDDSNRIKGKFIYLWD